VEHDPRAIAALRRNLQAVAVDAAVVQGDALAFVRRERSPYDLVFVDPPYDSASRLAGPLAEHLPALTSEGARIVTESDKRKPLELPFTLLTERTYGDTRIAIHAR
jgi:16S rRNA (guanine966-N2)-methyltransferase